MVSMAEALCSYAAGQEKQEKQVSKKRKRPDGSERFPSDHVKCLECNLFTAPTEAWKCRHCGCHVFFGREEKPCPCRGTIVGRRNGWWIRWEPCGSCDPEQIEKNAQIQRSIANQSLREERRLEELRVLADAAAQCLEKRGGSCPVKKRSKPVGKMCGSCKGGVNA